MSDNVDFKPLLLSGDTFFINEKGLVKDKFGNILKNHTDKEGELIVDLYWYKGFQSYKVAFLLLIVFKPTNIPFKFWDQLQIEYRNNNRKDLCLENLGWKYPNKGIESQRFPGYFYIPGFSKYLIDKQGIVVRALDKRRLLGSKKDSGYYYITLRPDVVKGRWPHIGRHRLMALTFIDNGFSVEDLDVNHIDGIPGNDVIENLEWCSRSENMLHAYALGKRSDNKQVMTTNVVTGEKTIYYSAHECERKLGLGRSKVHYRIKFGKGKTYSGLKFEYLFPNNNKKKENIAIRLTDLETNKILDFPSMKKCSEAINVSKKVIQKRIKETNPAFFRHYKFERI